MQLAPRNCRKRWWINVTVNSVSSTAFAQGYRQNASPNPATKRAEYADEFLPHRASNFAQPALHRPRVANLVVYQRRSPRTSGTTAPALRVGGILKNAF